MTRMLTRLSCVLSFVLLFLPQSVFAGPNVPPPRTVESLSITRLPVHNRHFAGPPIAYRRLQPFLNRIDFVSKKDFEELPAIVGSGDDYLIMTVGHRIYALGLKPPSAGQYDIYRLGDQIFDPETNRYIGYVALDIGRADMVHLGRRLSTLYIVKARRQILRGDRLLPTQYFHFKDGKLTPHTVADEIDGQILYILGGTVVGGSPQTVIINRGTADHLCNGDVMTIYRVNHDVAAKVEAIDGKPLKEIPEEYVGDVLIYHTYPHASLGLVVKAVEPIHVFDKVKT